MTKGEIWTIELPTSNGHEQYGERPAVIIADTKTSLAIIVPCTSSMAALRLPHTIRVSPTDDNGLSLPSILLALQLRAIDKKRLHRKLGTLETPHLAQLNTMLKTMLAL